MYGFTKKKKKKKLFIFDVYFVQLNAVLKPLPIGQDLGGRKKEIENILIEVYSCCLQSLAVLTAL